MPEMRIKLNKYIEHTLLKPDATDKDIQKICAEAKQHSFFGVCVNSIMLEKAKRELINSSVKAVCVVGFPLGACLSYVKAFEAEKAVQLGADEIDMVIALGKLKDRNLVYVENDIKAVVSASQGRLVKVILETHLLSHEEKVMACEAARNAKAHFVKTSTGFTGGGATVDDISLLKQISKGDMQVKASGGVRTIAQAIQMIDAGASRLGTSSGVALMGGASGPALY